jgi:hypothetical protein
LLPALASPAGLCLGSEPQPSRVEATLELPLGALARGARERLDPTERSVAGEAFGGWVEYQVRWRPDPQGLRLASDGSDRLVLSVPVDLRPRIVLRGVGNEGYRQEGCGPFAARVTVPLALAGGTADPRLVPRPAGARIETPGYRCVFHRTVAGTLSSPLVGLLAGRGLPPKVDVVPIFRARVAAAASGALRSAAGRWEALLGGDALAERLRGLAAAPFTPVPNLALGLDLQRVRVHRLAAAADRLVLDATLQGWPRVAFGTAAPGPPRPTVGEPPAATAFWLGAVAGRGDLAVLRRRTGPGAEDVIWLGGGHGGSPGDGRHFPVPLRAVLDQIAGWLDDPDLWGEGRAPAAELRAEVDRFRRVVAHFETPRSLPLGAEADLELGSLRLDLARVWLDADAIRADFVLRGRARVRMRLPVAG